MPTYQYECSKCGYGFSKFQNMTDKPVKTCPKCKGKVNRIIGAGGGIIFKGKGFYQTDYKNNHSDAGSMGCAGSGSEACKPCENNK